MKTFTAKILGYDILGDFMEKCKADKANVMAVSYVGNVKTQNDTSKEMFIVSYQSKKAILIW